MEHSAILLYFIKLPFGIKIFVLSIFVRPLKTGFTVVRLMMVNRCKPRTLYIYCLYMSEMKRAQTGIEGPEDFLCIHFIS